MPSGNTASLRATIAPILPMKWRGQLFRLIARRPVVSNPGVELPTELKTTLTEELRDDIRMLAQLTGHDLSAWYSV